MLDNNRENIDKSLFNEKALSLLNIRDLRDIGRKFGISSPTTMKKKDLVYEILKIVYGVVEVPVRNNCGRPSVREFDINKYIRKIKDNSDIADVISKMKLNTDCGTMLLSDKSEVYETSSDIEIRVFYSDGDKYYLRTCEFVSSPDDIEVTKDFVDKFKLKNLDVLEIMEFNRMFKIISINGIKCETKLVGFNLCGINIKEGQSQDFYLSTNEEIEKYTNELVNKCEKNRIKLLLLTKKQYSGSYVSNITYSLEEDKASVYKKLVTLVNLCTKEALESEDFVVLVEAPDDIEEIIKKFDDDVANRIKKYLEDSIFKMVKLGNIYITLRLEKSINY